MFLSLVFHGWSSVRVMLETYCMYIIDHQNYFQTSKGHVTWIIQKVNRIPTHCGDHRNYFQTSKGHVTWIIQKVSRIPTHCGDHQNYFQTSKGHMTWIIQKVNRIPTHCGVAYENVNSLARGHVSRVCIMNYKFVTYLHSMYNENKTIIKHALHKITEYIVISLTGNTSYRLCVICLYQGILIVGWGAVIIDQEKYTWESQLFLGHLRGKD